MMKPLRRRLRPATAAPSPRPAARNRRRLTRPFVFMNVAMTADGKIATANRAVTSPGSKRDLEHLYELRATADAVMSGARTVEESRTKLGPGGARFRKLRLAHGLAEYSLRVIVSGAATIDPGADIFRYRFSPIIILVTELARASRLKKLRPLADELLVCGEREIDFAFAFAHLRRRWNVQRLLCEGGGGVNDALFRAGLVDELHLTICPKIFGGRHAPTLADAAGCHHLADAAELTLKSFRREGDELFLVFRSKKKPPA
jgi:riboflavin-specific deaminase-like protein